MSSTSQLQQLKGDLSQSIPCELVEKLLDSYREIKENFYLGKHEPSELNGAKFCEVIARILEHEARGMFTPLGTSIKNMGDKLRGFENETNANESVRFHIPRVANAVYNIRNKRGVGHIGGDVDPNLADSTFVTAGADWILAELVRLHYHCTLEEAKKIVESLVQRRLFLVYEVEGKKRVLNPDLTFPETTLIVLAGEHPNGLEDRTLFDWTEHSNFAVYKRDVLRKLHRKRLIEYAEPMCTILPGGLKVVEDNYPVWASFAPGLSTRSKRKKKQR